MTFIKFTNSMNNLREERNKVRGINMEFYEKIINYNWEIFGKKILITLNVSFK